MKNNTCTVVYLSRKPTSGQVSIERVFHAVIPNLSRSFTPVYIQVPKARAKFSSLISNLIFTLRIKGDIIHITGDIHYCMIASLFCRRVLTIHDFGGYLADKQKGKIHALFLWLLWWYLPLKFADRITCISEFTKTEVLKEFPWASKKTAVIPDPLPEGFQYYPAPDLNHRKPIFLHLGTKKNKNLHRLAEAIRDLDCHLRIIGKLSDSDLEVLKNNNIDYSNAFNLSDDEIITEYANCTILCLVSTYEGFGMPIIEAQAVGRPVLTSNLSPMSDIAAGTAELVDPYDIVSIRKGIDHLLHSKDYYESMIQKGLLNASKYKAKNVSAMYEQLYNELN